MNKRILALGLCLAAMLSGCGDRADIPAEQSFSEPQYEWRTTVETLTLWCQEREVERSFMQRAFARYREKTGGELEITGIPNAQFEAQVAAAFASNAGPDILLSYGGTNIDSYYPDQNFYDFTNAEWVDDLTDRSINQTIYHGKVIGLPHWEASVSGTLYNKELFRKCGIEVPKTQAEFLDACETLLKNGINPVYLPYQETSMMLYQFPLDTLVEGPDVLAALNEGQVGYVDIPEMATVVEWYRYMAQQGYFGDSYQSNGWDGMNQALSSGKYAMMLCWDTWLYTGFDGNPKQFGLMPAFMGIPETGTFEGPNLALLIVNKNGRKVEAACNFITFMADPYNYNAAFEGIYTAPVFREQVANISTPQYVEAERLIERNYRDSVAWLRIRGFSQMDASCIQAYMESDGSYTAEQCLKDMDALRLERLL